MHGVVPISEEGEEEGSLRALQVMSRVIWGFVYFWLCVFGIVFNRRVVRWLGGLAAGGYLLS